VLKTSPVSSAPSAAAPAAALPARSPYGQCLVLGLGGLFAGVTGPLLSTFIPPLVGDVVGEHRFVIGTVMAIDNVLLLVLVPWTGAASDRAAVSGRGRLPLVLWGFVLASAGMALFPSSAPSGIAGLIGAMVVLFTGINLQRSPFQALIADLVPSRYRSLATGSVTFQMCVGAIVFLMLGRMLGMQTSFLIAAGTVMVIALAFAIGLREPSTPQSRAPQPTFKSLAAAVASLVRDETSGMRAVFIAAVLVQLTFQTFTTWYALHGTERFGVRPEEVTTGFIAWAVGGVIGALPAGMIGVRIGRRNTMLVGFAVMGVCLVALHAVTTVAQATPLLALASASWTLPMVNAYPLFVEPVPRSRRGIVAALFLLSMALGGALGDPLNGALFDVLDGYRPLFLMMAGYTAVAAVAVLFVPRGAGEADTGTSD
jgi:maltose/moltooligosaccharide transporter